MLEKYCDKCRTLFRRDKWEDEYTPELCIEDDKPQVIYICHDVHLCPECYNELNEATKKWLGRDDKPERATAGVESEYDNMVA